MIYSSISYYSLTQLLYAVIKLTVMTSRVLKYTAVLGKTSPSYQLILSSLYYVFIGWKTIISVNIQFRVVAWIFLLLLWVKIKERNFTDVKETISWVIEMTSLVLTMNPITRLSSQTYFLSTDCIVMISLETLNTLIFFP